MRYLVNLGFLIFTSCYTFAQVDISLEWKNERLVSHAVDEKARDYATAFVDIKALLPTLLDQQSISLDWEMPSSQFSVNLVKDNIFTSNYTYRDFQTGEQNSRIPIVYSFYGEDVASDIKIRLTIAAQVFSGILIQDKQVYYFEPIQLDAEAYQNKNIVLYRGVDVIQEMPLECGINDRISPFNDSSFSDNSSRLDTSTGGSTCRTIEVAQAYDSGMLARYGSGANLVAWNAAIWNAVNTLYQGDLSVEVSFVIVTDAIAPPITVPAGATPDVDLYLNNFRAWGEGGGFGANYDIGNLWTTVNVSGNGQPNTAGVVGSVMAIGGVCTSLRYQLFEDFVGPTSNPPTGNALGTLAVLIGHECGHNLGMFHNNEVGLNNIMEPFVNTAAIDFTEISEHHFDLRKNLGACYSTCTCIEVIAAEPVNCATDGSTYDIEIQVEHDETTGSFTAEAGGISSSIPYGANPQTIMLSNIPVGTSAITVTDNISNSCTSTAQMSLPTIPTISFPDNSQPYCVSALPASQEITASLMEEFGSIIIEVNGDQFSGSENSARILNQAGKLVSEFQIGTFASNENTTVNSGLLLLSDGPFIVQFADWFGDGMGSTTCQATNGGLGNYEIRDGLGNIIRAAAGLQNVTGSNGGDCSGNNAAMEITSGIMPGIDNTKSGNFTGSGITDGIADDGMAAFDPSGLTPGQYTINYTYDSFLGCTAIESAYNIFAQPTVSLTSQICTSSATTYSTTVQIDLGTWNAILSGDVASLSVNSGGVGTLSSSSITSNGTITVSNVPIANSFTVTVGSAGENAGCLGQLMITPPISCSVLPVEFLSFNANKNESKAYLSWSTATETNNNYFDIERSANGINFTKIGQIDAVGNSQTRVDYSWIDHSPLNAYNYYRLKQVDVDGSFDYSIIRIVDFSNSSGISVFPNPVSDYIYVVKVPENAQLKLYNRIGQMVYHEENTTSNQTIPINHLAAGLYVLVITNVDGSMHVEKVVVTK